MCEDGARAEGASGGLGATRETNLARGVAPVAKRRGKGGELDGIFVVRRGLGDDGAETNGASHGESVSETTDVLVGVVDEVEEGFRRGGAPRKFGERGGEDELDASLRERTLREFTKSCLLYTSPSPRD